MTIAVRILASVQVLIAFFGALVGSFADGGEWWERLVLVGVQPWAALLLLILVLNKRPGRLLTAIVTALLALNIVADLLLALAIGTGATRGDWWLPLIFSVIPMTALPYCVLQLRRHDV